MLVLDIELYYVILACLSVWVLLCGLGCLCDSSFLIFPLVSLCLLLPCFPSSLSWWLASIPLAPDGLRAFLFPCAGLHDFLCLALACVPSSLMHVSSITLSPTYLSHTQVLLLLLPLLLSFPPFPTPFSSGMIPNGTTPAGRVVGRGEMENRRCRRWREMRTLSLPSAPTHSLPCLPLCLPPLHGSFSLLRVNVSFYLSWVSPVWGGCLLLLALLVRSCPKIEWCFKFS